jgi:hypothetical protein
MKPLVETGLKVIGAVSFGAYAALTGCIVFDYGITTVADGYKAFKSQKDSTSKATLDDTAKNNEKIVEFTAMQLCIGATVCLAACSLHCTMGLFERSLFTSTTAFYSTAAFGAGVLPLAFALGKYSKETLATACYYLALPTLGVAYCVEQAVNMVRGK